MAGGGDGFVDCDFTLFRFFGASVAGTACGFDDGNRFCADEAISGAMVDLGDGGSGAHHVGGLVDGGKAATDPWALSLNSRIF